MINLKKMYDFLKSLSRMCINVLCLCIIGLCIICISIIIVYFCYNIISESFTFFTGIVNGSSSSDEVIVPFEGITFGQCRLCHKVQPDYLCSRCLSLEAWSDEDIYKYLKSQENYSKPNYGLDARNFTKFSKDNPDKIDFIYDIVASFLYYYKMFDIPDYEFEFLSKYGIEKEVPRLAALYIFLYIALVCY